MNFSAYLCIIYIRLANGGDIMNTKAKRINDFGRDHVPGLVLRVSVPFMFAQFVNVLYSIVDRIYIGNIPVTGADSLAGAGVCAPIITLLSSFATLIGIGGSILFSMRLGQDDKKDAELLQYPASFLRRSHRRFPAYQRNASALVRRQ